MYDLTTFLEDAALRAELHAAVYDGVPVRRLRDAKIKLTGRCNLQCAFCPFWRLRPAGELATDELKRVLDDLAALDCRKVHFSGGEPLLRADLPEMVAHAAGLGLRVALTTNGTLLTAELAHALLAARPHSITVSLDGPTPALHDGLRGVKGAFKRTVHGLKHLRRAKKALKTKTRIRLNMVLTRHNYHAYPDLLALAGELGVTDVVPLPVDEGGKSKNRLLPWQLQEYTATIAPAVAAIRAHCGFSTAPHLIYPFGAVKDDLRHAAATEYARGYFRDHLCYAPWLTTLIDWEGDVWLCCMTRGKLAAQGNVRHTSFRDIFLGEQYQAVRRQFLTERLALCHRCDNYLAENRLLEQALAT